jgi:hypothetical protein
MKNIIVFLAAAIMLFSSTAGSAVEEIKGCESSEAACAVAQSGGAPVSGRIFFSDYYSMGGEKCAAFLEGEDGELYCVLDNLKANALKGDMSALPGKVDVTGTLEKDKHGQYIKIDEYSVKGGAEEGGR